MHSNSALPLARRRPVALGACLLAAALFGGCESCDAPESGGASTDESAATRAAETGTIEGIVRLAAGSELPSYPQSPTSVPGREPLPPECTPSRARDSQPIQVGASGGLTNLVIVIADDTGNEEDWPSAGPPVVHEMAIRDCRTTPSVVVAVRGDQLRMANETDYPFFPDLGGGVLQALLRQEPREISLDIGGIRTIQCAFAAPCSRTEVVVLYHRLAMVTDEEGRFRIEGVPSDRPLRVTAWHPLMLEARQAVTVEAGATASVELEITPAVIEAPAPPPERPPGHPEDTAPPGEPF